MLSLCSGCGKNETTKMATIDDVSGKRIGVYTGTIYDKFAVERFPKATIMRYNSISDFVLALKNNKIDVAISNLYSAKNVIKTNPEIGILTDDLLSFPIGIGFNKNNPALREKFNAYIKAIKADGSFNAMYQKWFDNDVENVQMPQFKKNPAGPKVVLGVAVGDLPNVGFVKGQYVGFDVELNQTFAQRENLNLEIATMEFGSLVASLASGKVDMIASDHSPHPSDRKYVDKENFPYAAEGVSGLETLLPVMLDDGVAKRGMKLTQVALLTSENVARRFGLYGRKGALAVGFDADFNIVDMNKTWTCKAENMHYLNKHTPFDGHIFQGCIDETYVRGVLVSKDRDIKVEPGFGKFYSMIMD
jgi:ABC-type amino acid transport substrate-binding protein